MKHLEIERKFLVDELPPNLEQYRCESIQQGYLTNSGVRNEVRLRKIGTQYYLTVKGLGGRIREEREVSLSKGQFDTLWPCTRGQRIEKTRYFIPIDSKTVELDVYDGSLAGLVVAEVEFKSPEECSSFTPLDWFSREVSSDPAYRNESLARFGLPTSK